MHPSVAPVGDLVGITIPRQQGVALPVLEDYEELAAGGAVAAQPSHLQHNCGADVGQPVEIAAVEEALPDVGPASLHLGLVLGMLHPRRIDDESPALGVFQESPSEPGVEGVGFHHRGGEIVDRQVMGYPAEEGPGRLRPGDDLLQLLALLGADGTVPEVAQHDDHVPHRLAASRLRVMDQAQAGEISLSHLSRRGVSIRTVIVPSLRQFRFKMKRGRDGYDTEQPRLASRSWIRVICSRSCPGVPDCRGLDRLTLLAGSVLLVGAGPSRAMPSPWAAATYLCTVSRERPVLTSICRWLFSACQRRMTSSISIVGTSRYAIAVPQIEIVAMIGDPAPIVA